MVGKLIKLILDPIDCHILAAAHFESLCRLKFRVATNDEFFTNFSRRWNFHGMLLNYPLPNQFYNYDHYIEINWLSVPHCLQNFVLWVFDEVFDVVFECNESTNGNLCNWNSLTCFLATFSSWSFWRTVCRPVSVKLKRIHVQPLQQK